MVFNKTFIRTFQKLNNGTNWTSSDHDKLYTDLGTIQTDINNIETETDSLDSSISTANINISELLDIFDWGGNYNVFVSGTTINTSSYVTVLNISGEGWFSGYFLLNASGTIGDVYFAINVDGTDITTTSNPLIIDFSMGGDEVMGGGLPFNFHFNSSCVIKVKTSHETATCNITYWI